MNAVTQITATNGSESCNSIAGGAKASKRKGAGKDRTAIQLEALTNAVSQQSTMNYSAIFDGFAAMGIAPEDIKPRENVFSFNAWKALGRVVTKGQHGVKVCTYIASTKTDKETGEQSGSRRPWHTTVFHVSQTEALAVATA